MASRKDELRAYQFLKQRAVSALVVHETDPEQPPFRRPMVSFLWSIVIVALGLGIAAIVGLVSSNDTVKLQAGKSVIVVKGTTSGYLFLGGKLHPASSLTGALLALGKQVKTQDVSPDDIDGIPKGNPIGIADTPDAIPNSDKLLTDPWSMCSRPSTDANGDRVDTSELLVGRKVPSGVPAGTKALLVSVKDKLFWIAEGVRHQVTSTQVLRGLGLTGQKPLPVSATWLDAVPEGSAIRPIALKGVGGPSRALEPVRSNVRIGQIFLVRVSATETDYYVAEADRLRQITPLQLQVQITATSTARAYSGIPRKLALGSDSFTQVRRDPLAAKPGDVPLIRPDRLSIPSTKSSICATYPAGSATPTFAVGPKLPTPQSGTAVGGRSESGTPRADVVFVAPGRAALVQIVPVTSSDPNASSGTVALVTDDGRLFPFADDKVQKVLGYEKVKPVRVSGTLASRLPRGPALFTGTGSGPSSGN